MAQYAHLTVQEIKRRLRPVAESGICGPGGATMLDIGTSDYLTFFSREILGDLVGSGGASCRFFEGSYGEGKSHLLQLLAESASDRGFVVVKTELREALKLEDWASVTKHVLRNMELSVDGQVVRSFPDIVEHLSGLNGASSGLEHAPLSHPGFKNAMWILGNDQGLPDLPRRMVSSFLLGERVRVGDLKRNGVRGVKNSLTARNAELVLDTALAGLKCLSARGVVMLFDENERSFVSRGYLPSAKIRKSANLMRRFIDACMSGRMPGTLALFAVLPDFLENCGAAYAALGQRLETDLLHAEDIGWRSPVVRIQKISRCGNREDFAGEVVELFIGILSHCGSSNKVSELRLRKKAMDALVSHAGGEYRRALMKSVAAEALQMIDHAERSQ